MSGKDLTYFDPETNERYIPYVVEPSLGVERSVLAVLVDAYDEEVVDAEKNDVRVVLHLHPALAPYKAAVLPLSKKLADKAGEVYAELAKEWMIDFDETGSIGKRYRREDEVGTPVLHHRGLRHRGRCGEGRRQLRDRPRARHHGAGACPHQRAEGLSGGEAGVLSIDKTSKETDAERPSLLTMGRGKSFRPFSLTCSSPFRPPAPWQARCGTRGWSGT